MRKNLFIGKRDAPDEPELRERLGSRKTLWDCLVSEALSQSGGGTAEWNSYSPKAGWSVRIKRRDRNIVYLSPCDDCLLASFALGEKAIQDALSARLPAEVKKTLREAKKYVEGTAVRITVTSMADMVVVKQFIAFKLAK